MEGNDSQELKAQHKKAEEELSKLPQHEKQKIQPILELQMQRNVLYNQFLVELRALEYKYDQNYSPLYSQRAELLKTFSGFWLNAMKNNPLISSMVFEQDYELLKHITDIRLITEENSSNFTIEFHFRENQFIHNQVLSKKYILTDDDTVKAGEGTEIKWKGANLTQKVKKTKKRGKGKKVGTKVEEVPSFFLFFKSVSEDDEDEDEEEDGFGDSLEDDFEIGREFRDELIPNGILYYLNVVDDLEDDDSEDREGESDKPKSKKVDGSGTEKADCKPQ